MPKDIERKLMKEARRKFGTITSPRAKRYIWGTMRKIERRKKRK